MAAHYRHQLDGSVTEFFKSIFRRKKILDFSYIKLILLRY